MPSIIDVFLATKTSPNNQDTPPLADYDNPQMGYPMRYSVNFALEEILTATHIIRRIC